MRHQKKGKKFGRVRNQRKALMNGLAHNLASKGRIKTTLTRAKELKAYFDRLVTYAKKPNKFEGIRLLQKSLPKRTAVKMANDLGPKYKDRNGGYTRIIKLTRRKGDAAEMAIIEFV